MGYTTLNLSKTNKNKLKSLLKKSKRHIIFDKISGENDIPDNLTPVWFEGNVVWYHNSDEEKIFRYLDKKGIKFY